MFALASTFVLGKKILLHNMYNSVYACDMFIELKLPFTDNVICKLRSQ